MKAATFKLEGRRCHSIGSVTRVFDDAGQLISIKDWLNNTTSYNYDANGNLIKQSNPNGTTATITVDNADRVMGISHAPTSTPASPFASFNYGRDNEDKLTGVTSTGVPTDNHTWGYSAIDQLTTDTAKAFPYTYDSADNLTQLQDGTVQGFDVANQLTSSVGIGLVGTAGGSNSNSASAVVTLPAGILANDQILVSATMPANRNVTTPSGYTLVGSWRTGSTSGHTKMSLFRKTATGSEINVTVTFSATVAKTVTAAVYRGVNTTTPIEVSSNATSSTNTVVLPSVAPTLANSKLVAVLGATQGSVAGAVWSAPSGMVKQVEQSIASTDGAIADQRLTAAGATGTRTATLGTTGKLVGVLLALKPAVTTYGYDTRGNRTTRTAASTTTYGYNQANQLVSHANSATTTYTYNGDGLRVGRSGASSTTFSWDLSSNIPNLLVDGSTAYVYGPDGLPIEQVNGSTVLFYHHDQLGSTRALTNSAGTVVATYSYDPYGNPTGTTGNITNPFRFAGEYKDAESGLIYLRARYYDPTTGQFLTRDPLEPITGTPYAYVSNNPLNYTDPTGLWCPLGENANGSCRGSGTVQKYADDVSRVAGVVSSVCGVGAVLTSPTVVGGVALGICSSVAKGISLGAGALHTAVMCADLDAYCGRSAASLALNMGTGGLAGAIGPSAPFIGAGSDDAALWGLTRWVGQLNVEFFGNLGGFLLDTTERQDC